MNQILIKCIYMQKSQMKQNITIESTGLNYLNDSKVFL